MRITAARFKQATGYTPQRDDLERCNCKDAGQVGHWSCGWCEHDKPVFMCQPCFVLGANAKRKTL